MQTEAEVEDTYNPIREEEKPRIGLFNRVAPRPGFALVLQREGHPLVVLRRPGDRVTLGEALWGNHLRLYWIDTGEHSLEIRCQLPADTDAFSFSAVVHLRCAVEDPATVIDRHLTDVRTVLQEPVIDVMRGTSRRFSVEQSADAEREVAGALRERLSAPDFCPGMRVELVSVKLDLEEAARKHVRDLKEHDRRHSQDTHQAALRHDRELQETKPQHQREVEAARLVHEKEVEAARMLHEKEVEAARRRHQVEMQEAERRHHEQIAQLGFGREQTELQGELEKLRAEHERFKAEQEIERSKIYLPMIQQGQWALLSLFLAQKPERVSEVISVMYGQQQMMLDKQLETLRYFLEKDVVEKSDFEERGRQLLSTALEQLSAGIGVEKDAISPKLVLPGAGPATKPAAEGTPDGDMRDVEAADWTPAAGAEEEAS